MARGRRGKRGGVSKGRVQDEERAMAETQVSHQLKGEEKNLINMTDGAGAGSVNASNSVAVKEKENHVSARYQYTYSNRKRGLARKNKSVMPLKNFYTRRCKMIKQKEGNDPPKPNSGLSQGEKNCVPAEITSKSYKFIYKRRCKMTKQKKKNDPLPSKSGPSQGYDLHSHLQVVQNISSDAIEYRMESTVKNNLDMSVNNLPSLIEKENACLEMKEPNLNSNDGKEKKCSPPLSKQGIMESYASSCLSNKQDAINKETIHPTFNVDSDQLNESSADPPINPSIPHCNDGEKKMKSFCVGMDISLKDNPSSESQEKGKKFKELLIREEDYHKGEKTPFVCCRNKNSFSLDVASKQESFANKGSMTLERPVIQTRKKLLVLDLNGLLVDVQYVSHNTHRVFKRVSGKSVFKRPFCDEFLNFCFSAFDIGVWSSRMKNNVDAVVDFLMGDSKRYLLFCWDQSRCTYTGSFTIDNVHKPLVLKELKKLWDAEEPDLPWECGKYSPSNTLLIDDSPYKALCNPANTAIFPPPYSYLDKKDCSLGWGGDIRVYLEGLAMADDVQVYVQEHPFGQPEITDTDPSWEFYRQIREKFKNQSSTC